MKKIINTSHAPAPIGPYNQAVLSGKTLYISGQIPMDAATGNLIEGDIQMETKQCMENLAKATVSSDGNAIFNYGRLNSAKQKKKRVSI